jgi:F0F1-type ATP synthase delta subunit
MEKLYAQVLWRILDNGMDHAHAVSSLAKVLKRDGRMALMPKIAKAFRRIAQAQAAKSPRIFVARSAEITHAQKASGHPNASVTVDETLIGGWRLESAESIIDRSFKKYLLDIYNAAVLE